MHSNSLQFFEVISCLNLLGTNEQRTCRMTNNLCESNYKLEERGVLGDGGISVSILPLVKV